MLSSKKMNNVIFDLGRVLVDFRWKECLEELGYYGELHKTLANAVFLSPSWMEGDRGSVTPESWLQLFIQNAPAYEKEIRHVYENLGLSIRRFHYTDQLIQTFRKAGYKIYFLSNYSEYLYQMTEEALSFIQEFDGGVFSYQEKCLKPQEEIYKCILSRYNINSNETWFFDDCPENVAAAKKLGIQGVLFDQNTPKDILDGKYTGGIKYEYCS